MHRRLILIATVLSVLAAGGAVPAARADRLVGEPAFTHPKADLVLVQSPVRLHGDDAGHWVPVPAHGRAPEDLAAALGLRVVPNTVHQLHGAIDPYAEPDFGDQWALENTGQLGGVPGADVDAIRAWDLTTGTSDTIVAVLDSGVDRTHPDLVGRLWENTGEVANNGIDDDGNGYVDDRWGYDFYDLDPDVADDNGHGTFISGIVAAAANGIDILGLAPEVTVMTLRVCGAGLCFTSDVIAGVDYAIANGADVINMSFGSDGPNPALADAIDRAAAAGIVVVASAGNEGADNDTAADLPPVYPASFPAPSILAVTSVDRRDQVPTDFFGDYAVNYGATTVDLGAPGDEIVSLFPGGGLAEGAGTSFAAPFVAAAVALMKSLDPGLGATDAASRLKGSVVMIPSLAGITATGGRLNAYRAAGTALLADIAGSVFLEDILALYLAGVTKGCNPPDNDRFCPDRNVTRGEMAAFLGRALVLPSTTEDFFVDDDLSIFEGDINRLAASGITKGCNPPDNDRFCPDRNVTRGEMAAFLVRAFEYTDPGPGDWFVDDDDSIFENDIDRLRVAGVTKGCNPPTNDRFCPDDRVTRGQMAAFLNRALP